MNKIIFGRGEEPFIWCEVITEVNGVVRFEVINGAWRGRYDKATGMLNAAGQDFPATVLWQGDDFKESQYGVYSRG